VGRLKRAEGSAQRCPNQFDLAEEALLQYLSLIFRYPSQLLLHLLEALTVFLAEAVNSKGLLRVGEHRLGCAGALLPIRGKAQ